LLFVVGEAKQKEREQILAAVFDLTREEIVKKVESGTFAKAALAAHDYIYDIF
jgi:malate synthase